MFLRIIVSLMAVALAAEIFALVGMAVAVAGVSRRAELLKREVAEKLQPAIRLTRELRQSLQPELSKIRHNGAEIATNLSAEFHAIRTTWQDASRRAARLRLRLSREGVATVERLQRDQRVVRHGVLTPIRTVTTMALGVRATSWLLRKVA